MSCAAARRGRFAASNGASVRSIDWAADGKSIWTCASPREGEEMIVNVDLQGHVKPAVKEPSPYIGWRFLPGRKAAGDLGSERSFQCVDAGEFLAGQSLFW